MLSSLYIKNYALFIETEISFPKGLNVLTGETGAGKSLLVGALGLIMGKRADNSLIFYDEDKCVIEAEFSSLPSSICKKLGTMDEFDMDDNSLTIRREIRPNGKSRAFINDTPVSLNSVKDASALVLDLHGQHENQKLLDAAHQTEVVDAFAGTLGQVEKFSQALKEVQKIGREIHKLKKEEEEARQQLEYLEFQVKELNEANIAADEEENLEQELNLLQSSEDIREALGLSVDGLYQNDSSIYQQISTLLDPLNKVKDVSTSLAQEVERIADAREILKEVSFSMQNMLDTVGSDPERLAFIEERLAMYHGFKLKYQVQNGQELVEKFEALQAKIDSFHSIESQIVDLQNDYDKRSTTLVELGLKIEEKRLAIKPKLEKEICVLLDQVGFANARFEVAIERLEHEQGGLEVEGKKIQVLPSGINHIYFIIQTNPGVPAGLLAQIASGGEISRVMLALKAALAGKLEYPVMVFDEIDTGISGEIAQKVGNVMQQLAENFQILSITHLPQIAAKGHSHFQIFKKVEDENTTVSQIRQLAREDRIKELATMLSGEAPSYSAIMNATHLLDG